MKHINLLPPLPPKSAAPSADRLGSAILVALLVATLGRAGWLEFGARAQGQEIQRLEAELTSLEAGLLPLREGAAAEAKRQERLAAIQTLLARKNGWSETFREFSEALPSGVTLSGLTSTRSDGSLRFLLKGQSPSNRKIAEFLQRLEAVPAATGATLHFSERERNVQPRQYKFEMSVPVASLGGKP